MVEISLYRDIENKKIVVEEKKNKRGHVQFQANRMILTCTVRNIYNKLTESGVRVSLGKVMSLKPFFITYPTEKEISLCLCKLCLNVKMLLEPLMAKAKKDDDKIYNSASEFFMCQSQCQKGSNSYWKWKCCSLKCSSCRNIKPATKKCQSSQETVNVYQFELTETPYKKIDKSGNTIEKVSKKTDKVEHELTYKELYEKLSKLKKEYTCHKFQVYNDIHHWPKVVSTTSEIGSIYHMDFSENLSQMHKFEPQPSHFSKSQYSLHCTIKHCPESDHSPHQYMYHLSDVMQHNHAFTAAVVEHILSLEVLPDIIRFKSDNCSTQYKSKYVFSFWSSLAKKLSRNVIVYYGVSGHGKGLVDAMSAFGVKNPI